MKYYVHILVILLVLLSIVSIPTFNKIVRQKVTKPPKMMHQSVLVQYFYFLWSYQRSSRQKELENFTKRFF